MHSSILGVFAGGLLSKTDVAGKDVLEVGSGNVNGSVRPIIESLGPRSYLGVDFQEGPGVDRVMDAVDLSSSTLHSDVVVTTEMLEHVADWRRSVAGLCHATKCGGLLVITTRSPGFPYHGFPDDYWRYTPEVMTQILEAVGFEVLLCMSDPDPALPGVVAKARKPDEWSWPGYEVLAGIDVQPMVKPISILGLPHAPDGSGYYRFYLPFKHLANGGEQAILPRPGVRYLPRPEELDGGGLDVLVAQRICGADGLKLWESYKGKVALVYETDDDLLRVDPSGLPHLHDPDMQASIRRCLELADLVTVSTPVLAERYAEVNPNVAVLPNMVNADLLDLQRPQRPRVTVGWAGGGSHLVDWAAAADPLSAVLRAVPAADMHFVGTDWSPLLKLGVTRAGRVRFTPWQTNIWSYYASVDFDVALAPLASTSFCDAKSHIRALEMMALGIPVVASDCPAYRDMVVDGVTGYLVRTEAEWKRRLTELLNDADARAEMGAKGREVAAGWTVQEHWVRWRDAYRSVSGG